MKKSQRRMPGNSRQPSPSGHAGGAGAGVAVWGLCACVNTYLSIFGGRRCAPQSVHPIPIHTASHRLSLELANILNMWTIFVAPSVSAGWIHGEGLVGSQRDQSA